MSSCSDPSILTRQACVGPAPIGSEAFVDVANLNSSWAGPPSLLYWRRPEIGSFDDFGEAMRLLYVMSTADQWELGMYAIMGAAEADHAPIRDDTSLRALFPIAWMFVGFVFAISAPPT